MKEVKIYIGESRIAGTINVRGFYIGYALDTYYGTDTEAPYFVRGSLFLNLKFPGTDYTNKGLDATRCRSNDTLKDLGNRLVEIIPKVSREFFPEAIIQSDWIYFHRNSSPKEMKRYRNFLYPKRARKILKKFAREISVKVKQSVLQEKTQSAIKSHPLSLPHLARL